MDQDMAIASINLLVCWPSLFRRLLLLYCWSCCWHLSCWLISFCIRTKIRRRLASSSLPQLQFRFYFVIFLRFVYTKTQLIEVLCGLRTAFLLWCTFYHSLFTLYLAAYFHCSFQHSHCLFRWSLCLVVVFVVVMVFLYFFEKKYYCGRFIVNIACFCIVFVLIFRFSSVSSSISAIWS